MSTFLLWTIQTPMRAGASAWSCVLSTIDKSVRPSASLKGHRNFKISFQDYMAVVLLCTIQKSSRVRARTRARPRARAWGLLYCPQEKSRHFRRPRSRATEMSKSVFRRKFPSLVWSRSDSQTRTGTGPGSGPGPVRSRFQSRSGLVPVWSGPSRRPTEMSTFLLWTIQKSPRARARA